VVATDDSRIFDEVLGFGGQAMMTRADHRSGTDRCREALGMISGNYDAVVNIQGDEPFIDPRQIDQVADLIRQPEVNIATLARRITDSARLADPNTVKVVFGNDGNALYFSRHAIPFIRGAEPSQWLQMADYYQHIGIYAYKADTLLAITNMHASRLEQAESLEQLRWLENGLDIKVGVTEIASSFSIDTPDDLTRIPKELL
jgi:3-deoxy-manno-octulosonate cytidylyltransferase (CMP-KDO synthetase)